MADSFNICSLLIHRYLCFMDTGKHFEDKGFFHSFRQEVSHRTFRGMIQSQILLDFLFIFVQRQLCRDGIRSVTKIFELDLAD